MGTTLTGTTPQDTYDSLIKVTDNGPISGTLKALSDGLGNDSTLSLSTTAASIAGTLAVTGNATFDTNTLFVDAAANEVGIGTITPSAKLDVDGTSYVIVANNSAGNRKILFGVDAAVGEPAIQGALSNDTARKLLLNPAGGEIIIGANVSDLTRTLAVVGTSGLAVQYASASGTYLDITPNAANGLVTLTADARTGSFPDMTFRTSATEQMRITAAGVLELTQGQIKFPATQVASANANTLDDYEEGTFTPTIAGSTTAGTATYSVQSGRYTKIGNQVSISIDLSWNSGTGTGNIQITGLPFTNVSNNNAASFGYVDGISLTALNIAQGYVAPSASRIDIVQTPTGGGSVSDVSYDAAGRLIVAATYFVS